ncbi:MAG: transglycosylase domain-containing protein, partial [Nitriliruptorales bacterium]|nr:transglycosylase domain-containing protein [Nitriliruptorales bacterium]
MADRNPAAGNADASARLRHAVRRVTLVGLSALVASSGLLVLMAWLALNIDWGELPDPAALSAPTILVTEDGEELARFTAEVDRRVVSLDEISEDAVNAVIASEDARFREHDGVDPVSLLRAVVTNVRTGAVEQGGSTLTQQYVKNAYLTPERTIIRKIREAVISIQLERDLTKDEILERYLNTVSFGGLSYGIEAAALTYFGKPAARLTAAEGATLAQLLPAPSVRNPRVDPDGARTRRDAVLDRMVELGMLTSDEGREAKATPMQLADRPARRLSEAPFFVEYVRKQIVHAYGEEALLRGGLTVTVTLDREVQAAVEEAVAAQLPADEAGDIDAGAVAIDPATGNVLAIHGGRDFATNEFDLATQGRRQNGSTFKPFVFLAGIERGMNPDETYPAPGAITIDPEDCVGVDAEPVEVEGGPGGSLTVREALIRSVNTVYIQLGCELGPAPVIEMASRLGVRNLIPPAPAVALGGAAFGASVIDMASAYATIANDGRSCPARTILRVVGPDGRPLTPIREVTVVPGMETRSRTLSPDELDRRPEGLEAGDAGRCRAVLAADDARLVTSSLEQVVERTTGRRAQIGRPQAGKTGTTNEEKDAWFVGYTPDLSLAVWVGDPDHDGDGVQPMRNVLGFDRIQGGTIPALIWRDAASAILEDVPPR